MNKFYKSALSLLACAAMFPLAVSADLPSGETYFGSYDRQPSTEKGLLSLGYRSAGTYSVAYKIPSDYAGAKLLGVMVPFYDTMSCTGLTAWASNQLAANTVEKVSNDGTKYYEFTPEVSKGFSARIAQKVTLTEVRFDEPVTIPEDGIYMGYSFEVKVANTDMAQYPILTVKMPAYASEYPLQTFSASYNWADNSVTSSDPGTVYASAMLGIISGTPADAAFVVSPGQMIFGPNRETADFSIVNMGATGVKSFDYEFKIGEESTSGHIDLPKESLVYNADQCGLVQTVSIGLPEIPAKGTYPMSLKVTKVNGNDNAWKNSETAGTAKIVTRIPTKRPIIEELTSVKCGYCTRAFYGMEVLKRKHPESIIVSYHGLGMGDDPMACSTTYPISGGLPTAFVDRDVENNKGSVNEYFDAESAGFIGAWKSRLNDYGVADISVDAEWVDEAKTAVKLTSKLNFAEDIQNARFRLDYALLHDAMTGTPAKGWTQSNYYSGDAEMFSEPEWQKFGEGKSKITGLVYDDVCVAMGSRGMKGITGSVPTNIESDKDYEHSIEFKLEDCVNVLTNAAKKGDNLIQNKEKLRAVAVLINVDNGRVVNAAEVKLPGYVVGIEDIIEEDSMENAVPVAYYDLMGHEVKNPGNGIYIVRLSNGKAVKRVIR